uniref:Anoctamin n=1 Tax=Steinernema glaseri TaxID=37863 RepID=A0A1I8ATH0_9BILA
MNATATVPVLLAGAGNATAYFGPNAPWKDLMDVDREIQCRDDLLQYGTDGLFYAAAILPAVFSLVLFGISLSIFIYLKLWYRPVVMKTQKDCQEVMDNLLVTGIPKKILDVVASIFVYTGLD